MGAEQEVQPIAGVGVELASVIPSEAEESSARCFDAAQHDTPTATITFPFPPKVQAQLIATGAVLHSSETAK